MTTELVLLPGPTPKGYADGRIGHGRTLHVAGQVGWKDGVFAAKDLVGQFGQTLDNVLAVLAAAHAHPSDIAEMTIYVTDIAAYRAARRELGPVWRARFGPHFPAMALVGVAALVEPDALVEIQCVAYVEHEE
ncbi:MAG TPA: RidA family protein [Kofleriaceae bacterium]|jgi:enamine deaminase RidA (YjgF/YER057c/UK114 family)